MALRQCGHGPPTSARIASVPCGRGPDPTAWKQNMKTSVPIRIVDRSLLDALLPLDACIDLIDACMRQVSLGKAELPLRWGLPVGSNGAMGMMPGSLEDPACFGIKLVSLFPDNPRHGFSSHSGLMALFEAEYGQPIALMDAGHLTAVRTAAASAVATRALARPDARVLAIIGTGEQAELHGPAIAAVRSIEHIGVWGRTPASAGRLAATFRDTLGVETSAAATVAEAVASADIVCTVTAAADPVLFGRDLPAGCHVNAVGASQPPKRELDTDVLTRSRLFVDYRPSALAQAAELIDAIDAGVVTEAHIQAEIGEVLLGRAEGRTSDEEITLYRSLGVAAQDLTAAHRILREAEARNVGAVVTL